MSTEEKHVTQGLEVPDSLLTPEDRLHMTRIFNAIEVMYALNKRITPQLVITFLRICEEEFQTASSLADKCGIEAVVMTRHLQRLGSVNRHGDPGLGLITTVQGPFDLRERRAVLTERGVKVAQMIYKAISEKNPTPWKAHHVRVIDADGGPMAASSPTEHQ